ncbi:MAG: sigma-E factor negative regulatory protein [Burkholderiales bacterium]|nr:sigma-E factor negative regulatory protein [Burkholderiales bacterium]
MERISALMDGELDGDEAVRELKRCGGDATLIEGWATYHLIGDVLRAEAPLRSGFEARLREALAAEPTVLAPRPSTVQRKTRLFALSAAASAAGVLVVGWLAMPYINHPAGGSGQTGLAKAPLSQGPTVAEIDPSMKEYLLAHHESTTASMPSVTPYVQYAIGTPKEGAMSR